MRPNSVSLGNFDLFRMMDGSVKSNPYNLPIQQTDFYIKQRSITNNHADELSKFGTIFNLTVTDDVKCWARLFAISHG